MKKLLQLMLIVSLPIANATNVIKDDIAGPTKFIKVTPVMKEGIEGRKIEICTNKYRLSTICKNIGPKSFYSIEELEEVEKKIREGSNAKSLKSAVITTSSFGVVGAIIGYAAVVGSGGLILVPVGFAAGVGLVFGITASNGIDNVIRTQREEFLVNGVLYDKMVTTVNDASVDKFVSLLSEELTNIETY